MNRIWTLSFFVFLSVFSCISGVQQAWVNTCADIPTDPTLDVLRGGLVIIPRCPNGYYARPEDFETVKTRVKNRSGVPDLRFTPEQWLKEQQNPGVCCPGYSQIYSPVSHVCCAIEKYNPDTRQCCPNKFMVKGLMGETTPVCQNYYNPSNESGKGFCCAPESYNPITKTCCPAAYNSSSKQCCPEEYPSMHNGVCCKSKARMTAGITAIGYSCCTTDCPKPKTGNHLDHQESN